MPSPVKSGKKKLNVLKLRKLVMLLKQSSGAPFLRGLAPCSCFQPLLVLVLCMFLWETKTTEETILVSMKGDTVTVWDVFNSLKGSNQTQQSVLSATLQRVLEKNTVARSAKKMLIKPINKLQNNTETNFH